MNSQKDFMDPNPFPTLPIKRPRVNEDDGAIYPNAKLSKSNDSNGPAPFSTLGLGTESRAKENGDAVLSLPTDQKFPTLVSHTNSLAIKAENNPITAGASLVLAAPPRCTPSTVENSASTREVKPRVVLPDDNPAGDGQTINYTKTRSQTTTNSKRPTHREGKRSDQQESIARGPSLSRTADGAHYKPPVTHRNDKISKTLTRSSDSETALTLSTPTTLQEELSRWAPLLNYILLRHPTIKDTMYPRITVAQDDKMSLILGAGLHPIATAIAKIHLYGRDHRIPDEARQVLQIFHDLYRFPSTC